MQALSERLAALVENEQLTYWGVAELEDCREALAVTGSRLAAGFPRALALGVVIPRSIVDLLPDRKDAAVSVSYHFHGYQVLNTRLDLAASRVASMLERAGYRALPVSAAERIDSERICAFVSHKLVARRAGLGWIGSAKIACSLRPNTGLAFVGHRCSRTRPSIPSANQCPSAVAIVGPALTPAPWVH